LSNSTLDVASKGFVKLEGIAMQFPELHSLARDSINPMMGKPNRHGVPRVHGIRTATPSVRLAGG
jgi:hypothetical protein